MFKSDVEAVEALSSSIKKLKQEIKKVIVGQDEIIDNLLIALLSKGHCLLIGVPGLAKTLLIKTLAQALDLKFSRIQFTPDLMPSDITGTEILEIDPATNQRIFKFVKGPIFTNILLADEINRTPPKTQSALLEAMQELQVTAAGNKYPLFTSSIDGVNEPFITERALAAIIINCDARGPAPQLTLSLTNLIAPSVGRVIFVNLTANSITLSATGTLLTKS